MSVSPHLSEVLGISKKLGPVLPLCYGNPCACGGAWVRELGKAIPHEGHDIGKAPIGSLVPNGVKDATRNGATIDRWLRAHPDANIGLDLESAGLIFIDPDSPAAYAEAAAQGVEGGIERRSRNPGWLFKLPKGCPAINISKAADRTDLEIRADGYAVVWGTHANGTPVSVDWSAPLVEAPAWVVERLKHKAAQKATQEAAAATRRAERASAYGSGPEPPVRLHERGMRRWTGELVQRKKSGDVDRSDSLFFIGLDLAECNASENAIAAALEERDAALGWNKYTDRKDDAEYIRIAERAVASAIEGEQGPRLVFDAPPASEMTGDVLAYVEAVSAENAKLVATIATQRVNVLEERVSREELQELVHAIRETLKIPDQRMNARTKLVSIAVAMEGASRNSRGIFTLPNITLGEMTGLSDKIVGDVMRDLDAREGSPIKRKTTREYVEVEPGVSEPRSISEVTLRTPEPTAVAVLRALPTMGGPSSKEQQRLAKARERAAAATEEKIRREAAARAGEGYCVQHENEDVVLVAHCPEGGEIVGETVVRAEDFQALKAGFRFSTGRAPDVSVGTKGDEIRTSDEPTLLFRPPDRGWSCPAPIRGGTCRSLERTVRPDGSWRCTSRGHESRDYEALLPAVAGGAE